MSKEDVKFDSANDLLDCPFCKMGNDLHITETYSRDRTIIWFKILHGPENRCSVSMIDTDKNKLIERWNSRAI